MEKKTLIANRIQTPDGTILWSRFGHDFITYKDANGLEYMLDGGNNYQRSYDERDLPEEQKSKNLCVFDDAPWEEQREFILRGTFDNAGCRVWVPLSKLSNDHIKELAVADMSGTDSWYYRELQYRKEHNINIAEHDYANEGVEAITHTKE